MKMLRPILITMMWLLVAPFSFAIDIENADPLQLYKEATSANNSQYRYYLRSKLAERFPKSGEGLFALAWLAGKNGNKSKEKRLYQEAVEKSSDLHVAFFNLGAGTKNASEGLALFKKAYEASVRNHSIRSDHYLFIYYNEQVGGGSAGILKRFEDQLKSGNHIEQSLYLSLNADLYMQNGLFKEASDVLLKSVEIYPSIRNIEQLYTAVLYSIERGDSSSQVLYDVANRIVEIGADPAAIEFSFKYLAELIAEKAPGNKDIQVDLYQQAYAQRHSPAMAIELGLALGSYGGEKAEKGGQLLKQVTTDFPDYADGWDALAFYSFAQVFDKEKFILASEKSIETSKGKADLLRFLPTLAARYATLAMADKGLALLEKYYPQLESSIDSDYYYALVEASLTAMQFTKAERYLNEAIKQVPYSVYWEKYRTFINMAHSAEKEHQTFYHDNPFLKNWESQFGKSIQLSINFAVNSASIPVSAHKQLDKAARALKQSGGENYLFEVEGHTDSSGSNSVNIPLSKKRAEAVVDYFYSQHGISSSRLMAKGFGSTLPIASNWTEEGKRRNRRVEIKPMGNIQQPQFAIAGDLQAAGATFSKDGRYMATGHDPIRLWDLERGITIKELRSGGSQREFSPDGRYLAVISNFNHGDGIDINALYIVDTKTGIIQAPLSLFGEDGKFEHLTWSPDSNRVAFTTNQGYLGTFDLNKNKLIHATRISDIAISGSLVWVPDTHQIAVAQANSNHFLRLFNADTLALENTVRGVNWAHSIAYVAEYKKLVVANNDHTFTVYDINSPDKFKTFPHNTATPDRMLPIVNTPYLLVNDKFDNKTVSIFNIEDGTSGIFNEYEAMPYIGVSPDGRYARVATGETLLTYDLYSKDSRKPIAKFQSATPVSIKLSFNKKHEFLISEDSDGTAIWHLLDGRKIHSIDKINHLSWYQSEKNESQYFSLTKEGDFVSFNLNDFKQRLVPLKLGFEPTQVIYNEDLLIIAGVEPDSIGKGGVGYIAIYNFKTLSKLQQTSLKLNTEALAVGVWSGGFSSLDLSDDGSRLLATTWWNDGGRRITQSKMISVWDTNNLNVPAKIAKTSRVPLTYAVFKEGDSNTAIAWGPASKMDINLSTSNVSNYSQMFTDVPDYGKEPRISREFDRLIYGEKQRRLDSLAFSMISDESLNLAVVYTLANSMEFYQLDTLEKKLTIQNRRNGEWVAFTPSGYYNASLNGLDGVYWSFGDYLLPFENMQEKYINPRKVKQALQDIINKRKTDNTPVVENDVIVDMPYKVTLMGEKQVTTDKDSYTVQLKVVKTDKSKPDPDFYFTINSRKTRGFDENPFVDEDENITITRKVPLGIGDNIVVANMLYKGVVTYKQEVVITRKEKQNHGGKGNLWFFGVGVSQYDNPIYNLDFAHRDAEELGKALKQQQGRLFENVNTRVLTNSAATAREIKIEMNEFLSKAGKDDLIVIFIAGHGVQDGNQNLYFMAHDGELDKPYTGMPIDEFKAFLDRRPVNQKALFLLDICHSGNGINNGRITVEEAIKALSDGTATTVFSSSKGAQQSIEDETFGGGHGAFTYSLLEAMKKGDEQMGDNDGYTSLMEMMFYTIREVPRLTNRAQTPAIPILINTDDYPIAIAE